MAEDNKNYEIEVEIYDMEFWENGFTYDNIEFIPYDDYKKRYEKIKNDKIHYPTGKAKISLSAYACNEAISKAQSIFSNYGRLLTFAQGHYVFSHYYKCYEVENGNRHKNGGLLSSVVGVDTRPGVSIIRPAGIEEFINKAIPLTNDKEYVEETGIVNAISWFIVGNPWHIETVSLMFPIKWMVLEMLANAHAKSKGKEFQTLKEEIKETIDKFSIDKSLNDIKKIKGDLYHNVLCIQRVPISHRIGSLLKKYGFKQYSSEIEELKIFRDNMFHGSISSSYNFNEEIHMETKIIRILEKTILSVLHSYDNKFVRSAIKKDSLLEI
jgi:predicted amino acid-binding ACT domain protein